VTSEVEQLKRDRLLLLKEVMRLREEQNTTADEVRRLSSRLTSTEQFQTTMMGFVEQVRESGGTAPRVSQIKSLHVLPLTLVTVRTDYGDC
jgi:uncharacterized protein YlxW (UPF0749 family)